MLYSGLKVLGKSKRSGNLRFWERGANVELVSFKFGIEVGNQFKRHHEPIFRSLQPLHRRGRGAQAALAGCTKDICNAIDSLTCAGIGRKNSI